MKLDPYMLWFKLTWVLGFDEFYFEIQTFFESGKGYRELIKGLMVAFEKEEWAEVKKLLKRVLGILKSNEFEEWLIKKIGKKAAKGVFEKVAQRFIPVFGWILTAAMIVTAIIGQFIK